MSEVSPATAIGADLRDIQYGKRHHRHWHYVYKKRRKKADTISSKQIAVGQIIALTGSLVAGVILEVNKEHIALFAGALVLLPGIIDLGATITGVLCAKIGHQMDQDQHTLKIVTKNIAFSFMLTAFSGLIVGLVGGLIGELFFEATFWKVLVLCQSAMLIVGMISYPVMSLVTVLVKRAGIDPDNVVGPAETGFTDALMVLTISIIVRILA